MIKGLYYCSVCKQRFIDTEATTMHIKAKHKGVGSTLRHPSRHELLIMEISYKAQISKLEAQLRKSAEVLKLCVNHLGDRGVTTIVNNMIKEIENEYMGNK